MKQKAVTILLFLLVLSGGAFFRLWRLNDRPMHTDEAVHAEKFGDLLGKGDYAYDPHEFHGPTLNYFTLIGSFLSGWQHYAETTEATLRLVPAVFGILLILSPLFFYKGMNRHAVLFSCVLIAFSPAFVYYSRYYIQEMLLVFFTAAFLGCGWRYIDTRKIIWIILSGVSVGLMHATKETFVFSIFAAFAALIFHVFFDKPDRMKCSHLLAAITAMVTTSVLFFSSFGTNPQGILDSIATYCIWIQRAGGQSVHIHRWYYYLNLLTWLEFIEPITWNEDGIVVLALFGCLFTVSRRTIFISKPSLPRFLVIYTLTLTMIYCLIPYKTPWCILSFLFPMTLLAGFVLDWLIGVSETIWERYIVRLLIVVFVILSPIIQSWFLNFHYASDPTNPYVYAHTSSDIYKMIESVEKAAEASPKGKATPVQIIAPENDYWPFPWYFRNYSKVGFWNYVDNSAPQAPIILAHVICEKELLNVLYTVPPAGQKHLYVPLFDQTLYLRPGVEWRGYVRKELWEQIHSESAPIVSSEKERTSILSVQPDKKTIDNLVKFSHRAMNANFEVFIQHEDGTYAGRAARAAFSEVDRLEGLLSRFIENSDVNRINALPVNEEAVVDEDTMKCLQVARRAYELTDGAFNIAIGNLIAARKRGDAKPARQILSELPTPQALELNAEMHRVKVLQKGVSIDLGGVGKGYAVDAIAEILTEWGVKRAMIHGGASSVRALAAPAEKVGWPVIIRNPVDASVIVRLEMADEGLSCSGLQRGDHIINPFTGRPVTDRRACWIRTKQSAALADALTTAGMIMPVSSVTALDKTLSDVSVMLLLESAAGQSGEIIKQGDWPK